MSYDQTVPATGHSGSQDYTAIRNNFVQLQSSFSVNHEPLASGGVDGYHTQIQLAAPITDPGKTGTIGSIYTKGSPPELFFQNASSIFQLTGNAVLSGSEYTITTSWGLILKLGQGSASNTGVTNNFSSAFPNSAIGLLLSPRFSGALSVGWDNLSLSSFRGWLQTGPGTQIIFYLAWGT